MALDRARRDRRTVFQKFLDWMFGGGSIGRFLCCWWMDLTVWSRVVEKIFLVFDLWFFLIFGLH